MKYIFAGSQRIARKTATAAFYFHQDHLGSASVVTDAAGAQDEATEYLPYGGQRSHSGTLQAPYKFTDQELDASTGLYNYNARFYDPITGRFISADTLVPDFADPQTLNRYSYCRNNPLLFIDPSGHWFGIDDLVSAAVGAVVGGVSAAINGDNILEGAAIGAAAAWVGWNTGGLAYAAIGGQGGMAILAGGIVGGAGGGATGSGLYAAANGGNIGEGILQGAGYGAIVGGISGGLVAMGVPNIPIFGSSAAADIPNRIFNSALIGAGFEAAYAGMTGSNIAEGAIRGATAWGIGSAANIAIGHGLGYALSRKSPQYRNGVFVYEASGQRPFSVGGAVIGDPVELNVSVTFGKKTFTVFDHEIAHSNGWQSILGPAYLPAHLASQGASGAVGMMRGENFWYSTHKYNLFERYWHEYPMW